MREISDKEMTEMHDLIANIHHHYNMMDRDVRNLDNLIHYIKGDGVRAPEFKRE